MWTQHTVQDRLRRRGGGGTPGKRARRRNLMAERRRRGAPQIGRPCLMCKAAKGGKGEGEPQPRSARPRRGVRKWGGPRITQERNPPCARGNRIQRGDPSELSEHRSLTEDRL